MDTDENGLREPRPWDKLPDVPTRKLSFKPLNPKTVTRLQVPTASPIMTIPTSCKGTNANHLNGRVGMTNAKRIASERDKTGADECVEVSKLQKLAKETRRTNSTYMNDFEIPGEDITCTRETIDLTNERDENNDNAVSSSISQPMWCVIEETPHRPPVSDTLRSSSSAAGMVMQQTVSNKQRENIIKAFTLPATDGCEHRKSVISTVTESGVNVSDVKHIDVISASVYPNCIPATVTVHNANLNGVTPIDTVNSSDYRKCITSTGTVDNITVNDVAPIDTIHSNEYQNCIVSTVTVDTLNLNDVTPIDTMSPSDYSNCVTSAITGVNVYVNDVKPVATIDSNDYFTVMKVPTDFPTTGTAKVTDINSDGFGRPLAPADMHYEQHRHTDKYSVENVQADVAVTHGNCEGDTDEFIQPEVIAAKPITHEEHTRATIETDTSSLKKTDCPKIVCHSADCASTRKADKKVNRKVVIDLTQSVTGNRNPDRKVRKIRPARLRQLEQCKRATVRLTKLEDTLDWSENIKFTNGSFIIRKSRSRDDIPNHEGNICVSDKSLGNSYTNKSNECVMCKCVMGSSCHYKRNTHNHFPYRTGKNIFVCHFTRRRNHKNVQNAESDESATILHDPVAGQRKLHGCHNNALLDIPGAIIKSPNFWTNYLSGYKSGNIENNVVIDAQTGEKSEVSVQTNSTRWAVHKFIQASNESCKTNSVRTKIPTVEVIERSSSVCTNGDESIQDGRKRCPVRTDMSELINSLPYTSNERKLKGGCEAGLLPATHVQSNPAPATNYDAGECMKKPNDNSDPCIIEMRYSSPESDMYHSSPESIVCVNENNANGDIDIPDSDGLRKIGKTMINSDDTHVEYTDHKRIVTKSEDNVLLCDDEHTERLSEGNSLFTKDTNMVSQDAMIQHEPDTVPAVKGKREDEHSHMEDTTVEDEDKNIPEHSVICCEDNCIVDEGNEYDYRYSCVHTHTETEVLVNDSVCSDQNLSEASDEELDDIFEIQLLGLSEDDSQSAFSDQDVVAT